MKSGPQQEALGTPEDRGLGAGPSPQGQRPGGGQSASRKQAVRSRCGWVFSPSEALPQAPGGRVILARRSTLPSAPTRTHFPWSSDAVLSCSPKDAGVRKPSLRGPLAKLGQSPGGPGTGSAGAHPPAWRSYPQPASSGGSRAAGHGDPQQPWRSQAKAARQGDSHGDLLLGCPWTGGSAPAAPLESPVSSLESPESGAPLGHRAADEEPGVPGRGAGWQELQCEAQERSAPRPLLMTLARRWL